MKSDDGAAIVEFALVVPILILLVFGITEFGRAFFIKSTLSAAAREGARAMALANPASGGPAAGVAAANTALGNMALTGATASADSAACPSTGTTTQQAKITTHYTFHFITGLFGTTVQLEGKGVMRCNG